MNAMPWIDSYPAGVRWDIDIEAMPVQRIHDDSAAKWPDNFALQFMGRRIPYRELKALAEGKPLKAWRRPKERMGLPVAESKEIATF